MLLALLEHVGIEGGADARRHDHTHGEHDAHPSGHILIGHALVGIDSGEGIEQHHTRGADDDGPLHMGVETVVLHLEIHEE